MYNKRALHAAIFKYDIENFNRLLQHPMVDVNYRNSAGETPLLASINSDLFGAPDESIAKIGYELWTENIFRWLCNLNVDIILDSIKKRVGSTMAMSLIRAGCDINCKNPYNSNSTPLHDAIKNDLFYVAHELILRGADINARTDHNNTPLCKAISKGDLEAVCLLLYYQADVNRQIFYYGTHFILAVEETGFSKKNNICKVLLDYCVDFSCKSYSGRTPLNLAIDYRNHPLVVDLVKRGANVNYIGIYNLLYLSLRLETNELFKLIWSRLDHTIFNYGERFMLQYLDNEFCSFSNSEWLECFYLILNSPDASTFIKYSADVVKINSSFSILWTTMMELSRRKIELKDRISIIYIYLSLGVEIKPNDLRFMYLLFGSNDVFEVLICTQLSYKDYKEQMRFLFKELYNSPILFYMLKRLTSDYCYMTLIKQTVNSLGFFSVLPETKKWYLTWIEKYVTPKYRDVFLIKLNFKRTFPSLLELSRNQAQKFIEVKFKVVKAYQFYDAVRSLKFPQMLEDAILFKQPIY